VRIVWETKGHNLTNDTCEILWNILLKERHRCSWCNRYFALIRPHSTRENAHQRRFSSTISTEKAYSLARFNMTAHSIQERRTAKP
jgi:hypothetical protein